ncbi:MAG: hypothetical protein ACC726_09200 [Chloroflexota bacterium]
MEIVDVIEVIDRFVATFLPMHMHVRAMRQVLAARRVITVRQLVDMIGAGSMDVAVVQEIHVVVVAHRRVPAPSIVLMIVALDRSMCRPLLGTARR